MLVDYTETYILVDDIGLYTDRLYIIQAYALIYYVNLRWSKWWKIILEHWVIGYLEHILICGTHIDITLPGQADRLPEHLLVDYIEPTLMGNIRTCANILYWTAYWYWSILIDWWHWLVHIVPHIWNIHWCTQWKDSDILLSRFW